MLNLNLLFKGSAIFLLALILLALVMFILGLLEIDYKIRGRPMSKKEKSSNLMAKHAERIKRQQECYEHRARYEHRLLMQAQADRIENDT